MSEKEFIQKTVNDSKEAAIKYLMEFCKKININMCVIDKLRDVRIKLDSNPGEAISGYDAMNNTIVLSKDYLYEIALLKNQYGYDDARVIKKLKGLTFHFLHEMLHAIRTICDSENLNTYEKIVGNKNKFKLQKEKELINICDCLLCDSSTSPSEALVLINQQNAFEEILIEGLTYAIWVTRQDDDFSWSRVEESNAENKSRVFGIMGFAELVEYDISIELLKKIGDNGIKEFLEASYNTIKNDPFRKFFGSDYNTVLEVSAGIYSDIMKDKPIKHSDLRRIREIK